MRVADIIVEILYKEGITHVFGVPGEQVLALVDAFYDSPIKFITTRHESGAGFMAEAYGKATGKPAVCLASAGVGATNLSLAIHTAKQDSTPLIAIIGQIKSMFRGREAWQEIDLESFFSPLAKWAIEIKEEKQMPEIIIQAIHTAKIGRPGPVVIAIPADILEKSGRFMLPEQSKINKPGLSLHEIKEIIHLINKSKKPLILAGGGVAFSDARDELLKFSELSGIPVMTSFRRHDIFPNDHPHYLGNSGVGIFTEIVESLKEADLILAIGTRLSQITTQQYTLPRPEQLIVHIDIDPQIIANACRGNYRGYISDAKLALNNLLDHVSLLNQIQNNKTWALERRKIFELALSKRRERALSLNQSDLTMEKIIEDLSAILPENAVLTSDAGSFYSWLINYYHFRKNQRYLGPTSGAMGYGLPAAIAAKLVFPDRPVVSLSGDGGFMMTMQEFETAVRYHVPIISIVFNNNAYGATRLHQEILYPGRVIGSELTNPPFDQLANILGGIGYKANSNSEFKKILSNALQEKNKPVLIEVPLDPHILSASKILYEDQLLNI